MALKHILGNNKTMIAKTRFIECSVQPVNMSCMGTIFSGNTDYVQVSPRGILKDNDIEHASWGPIKSWSICLPKKYILGNLLPVVILEETETLALIYPRIEVSEEDERFDWHHVRKKAVWVLKRFLNCSIYN